MLTFLLYLVILIDYNHCVPEIRLIKPCYSVSNYIDRLMLSSACWNLLQIGCTGVARIGFGCPNSVVNANFWNKTNILRALHDQTRSLAAARENTLQPVQFLLQYWPWRSSKVDDFHLIWKVLCDLLLISINSNNKFATSFWWQPWPYLSPFLRYAQFSI